VQNLPGRNVAWRKASAGRRSRLQAIGALAQRPGQRRLATRAAAAAELEKLGDRIEPRSARASGDVPVETRRRLEALLTRSEASPDDSQVRSLEALSQIASADAAGLLESLAKGHAMLVDARTAETLERVRKR